MNRSTSLAVVAALFLSGVAIGALGMHLHYWRTLAPRHGGFLHSPPPGSAPAAPPSMTIGWMERELDLNAEQRDAIREILTDSMRRGGEMRRELRPRVEELMRQTSERIAEVLTDEQRRRYDELKRRQGDHFERGFLGPPGGRGPMRRRPGPPPRRHADPPPDSRADPPPADPDP